MDLRETAFSRGGATKGEAWMRFWRRLHTELGEDVFSSWFGCLELDALSGQHAHLSVPTKFLKRWIQLHYADRILVSLVSEFPAVKRVSINVRSSARQASAHATNTYAERAIHVLVRTPEPTKIKVDDIQKRVASHFKVSRAGYSLLAANGGYGAPTSDRHVSLQALDPAFASGNRAPFRR
jgi:chromosomal replication initiation ATPase DnaA